MLNLGLLGHKINHSRSPNIYKDILGEVNYKLFDFDKPPRLKDLWGNLDGLSITSPFKRSYQQEVEFYDAAAIKCQSINTVKYQDKKFIGINTDYQALYDIFTDYLVKYSNIYVYLLGNGVMASISKLIFNELNIEYRQFSRSDGDISKLDLTKTSLVQVIVVNSCSRDFYFRGKISKDAIFFDYNYDIFYPFPNFRDGLDLLTLQAKYAVSFWKM